MLNIGLQELNNFKKAIHFIDDSPFGYISNGRDNWLLNIAKQLCNHYDVNIHCTRPSGRLEFYDVMGLQKIGVKIARYSFANSSSMLFRIPNKLSFYMLNHIRALFLALRVYDRLKEIVREGDIIFSLNPSFEALPGLLLRRRKKIIDICLMKGRPAYESTEATQFLKRAFFALERYFVKNAQHLFSNGDDTREYILSMYGRNTGIINNGVDLRRFQAKEEGPLNDDKPLIKTLKENGARILLFVGTLHWRKGIEFIFDLPLFLDRKYDGNYVIVLLGKGRPDLFLEKIRNNGAEGKYYFLGEQTDIPFFYHQADLSLHLSYGMGGISHATLEALASGTPIVAWDNRTYNQFLTSGFDSILVPEGDTEELARAVKNILEDESLSSTLRKNSIKTAMRYDWHVVSEELLATLRKIQNDNA